MSLRIMHISTRLIRGGSQENTLLTCQGQRTVVIKWRWSMALFMVPKDPQR